MKLKLPSLSGMRANSATLRSPIEDKSSSSVAVRDARLWRLNFSNLVARVIWMDFRVLPLPEWYKDFYSYAKLSQKRCFYPWRCAEFVNDRELVQAFVNIYPHTKAEMRSFAMKASHFECLLIWSDAKPIQLLSDEEASVDSIQRKLDILHMGLPRYDGQIKEPTIIYVPKTTEEFGDGEKYAKMLIELSSPSTLGGLNLPERENSEYAMQSANVMQRMQMRIRLRGGHPNV